MKIVRVVQSKWLRRILGSFLLLLIAIVAVAFYLRISIRRAGETKLHEMIAYLNSSDPNWELKNPNRAIELPWENSSTSLIPMLRMEDKAGMDELAKLLADPSLDNHPNCKLPEATAAAIQERRRQNETLFLISKAFYQYPEGHYRDRRSDDWQEVRREMISFQVGLLCVDSDLKWAAHINQTEEGKARVNAALNAIHALDGEQNFMISKRQRSALQLACRGAERILGSGQWKESPLSELQKRFQIESESLDLVRSLRGERAFRSLPDDFSIEPPPDTLEYRLYRWGIKETLEPHRDHINLSMLTSLIESKSSDPEWRVRVAELKPPSKYRDWLPLPMLLTNHHSIAREIDEYLEFKALARCTSVGLAVERYRLQKGEWPKSLQEIPKEILPHIPTDPFTGKALHYARTDEGVVIYSVGKDLSDEGGKLRNLVDILGREDIPFRLYDLPKRGLPYPSTTGSN